MTPRPTRAELRQIAMEAGRQAAIASTAIHAADFPYSNEDYRFHWLAGLLLGGLPFDRWLALIHPRIGRPISPHFHKP